MTGKDYGATNFVAMDDYLARVVTRSALGSFERQTRELCKKVRRRLITRSQAVEILRAKSTYDQIIRHCGPLRAEQIMEEHLNTEEHT
ncbi:hypothetical protein [Bradyrhizobium sp. SZCCHNR1015]|uniref:hypothetical protein n=1 Tax=Bradyrhizobium sp. SZCCHNR1015 TaxID=3057338 RepID=UPI0029160E65|nr:hypothetical protein [Bradyrhizobium sp. SZCCHNR1015]